MTDSSSSPPSSSSPSLLDLVFLVDCTASMSGYIHSAQQNMKNIVEKILSSEKCSIECAIVAYRDWCDQSTSYVTKTYPFTSSLKTMQTNINQLSAQGGGDLPEAITAGLADVDRLSFRKDSVRICILIGDAPDHGLGEPSDSLAQGDPQGRDPLQICRSLASKNVIIYSVACEPSLSNSQYGRDFFMTVARLTQGQFLPLTSANLLADVVIGGAKEELSLQALQTSIEEEAKRIKKEADAKKELINEEEIATRVAISMASRGTKANRIRVDDVYQDSFDMSNVTVMETVSTLAEARKQMKPVNNTPSIMQSSVISPSSYHRAPPMPMSRAAPRFTDAREMGDMPPIIAASPSYSPFSMSSFSSAPMMSAAPAPVAQSAYIENESISVSQVSRMMKRAANKSAAPETK